MNLIKLNKHWNNFKHIKQILRFEGFQANTNEKYMIFESCVFWNICL